MVNTDINRFSLVNDGNTHFSLVRELKLEMMSELPHSPDVLITAEDVEGFEPCGKYKPHLEMFSSGRRVFKHESEEFFLYGNIL